MSIKYTINHKDVGDFIDFEMLANINGKTETIQKWKVHIEEEAIKNALISRGWTPPDDE